jgi:hypothetical protein
MAVAQPKPKSAPAKASNAAPKGKMQMHRRSRTGLWELCYFVFPVNFLVET